MGIRIQPREIDVPEDDPFRYDLLGRKESVEVLTHLVGDLEGPCVLAVDAAWGNGKTTFLKIWAQHLRNQGFPIVKFNAWETDFSGDPFVALSKELTTGLEGYTNESLAQEFEDRAQQIFQQTLPTLIQLGTATIPVVGTGLGTVLASYAKDRMSSYQQAKESVPEFRKSLQDMAEAVSKSKNGRPLLVMIDELDRCRPSYAVELLEVAKHLFAVDHIIFVLAVNRSELAHSIKALYGDGFDAQGYLRRFFDVDFVLPEADRKAFIDQMLASLKIDNYFERTQESTERENYKVVKKWLQCFFHAPDLNLRRIAQAIHRLGLVFASLRSDQWSFAKMAAVALILRTIDSDLYHKFVRGDITDVEVVDKVFNRPGARTLQHQHDGHLFEAAIIVATADRGWLTAATNSSQQLQQYHKLIGSDESSRLKSLSDMECLEMLTPTPDCSGHDHARRIILLVRWHNKGFLIQGSTGFKESVQRIELLSTSLIDDPAQAQKN